MSPKVRLALILGTTGVLLQSQTFGRASAQQTPLRHEVSVTLKLVQVYVTDKSGRPVADLTKDDFRVFDGGKRVAVTEFERHEVRAAERGAEARPEAPVLPGPEIPSIKRKFILFFDFAFNTHRGVAAGVKAALDFLDANVGPDDETALVSYSMLKGLKVHEFLTADRDKVRKAVSEVTSKDIAGRADEVEQAYWAMVDMAGTSESRSVGAELKRIEMQRQDSRLQTQKYFRALADFARALRLVQGQKHLLFFSNGVPNSLIHSSQMRGTDQVVSGGGAQAGTSGAYGGRPVTGSRFEIGDAGLRPLLDAMLKELNGSGCALYAFDTRESALVLSLFAYDEMAFTRRTGGMFLADNVGTAVTSPFRDEKTTGMDTLKLMSGKTGGKYYGNIQFHERDLVEVADLTGSYYVLGYTTPAPAADGKFREVKVEVVRKGCVVRAQRGYYNPKPFQDYTDIERKLHLFDLALNGRSDLGAPAEVPMTVLVYATEGGARVRALARIPREAWEGLQGRTAEIVPMFFDGKDSLLSLRRAVVDVAGQRGRDLVFTVESEAPPGAVDCRLVVRDLDTGRSALGRSSGFVRASAAGALALATPLVLVPGGGVLFEGVTEERTEERAWREIYAYDPESASPVIGDEPVRSDKVMLIVPARVAEGAGEALGVKLALVDTATGESRDLPYALVRRTRAEGHEVLFLEAATEGLPAGKHLLYVHAGLGGSDGRASVHVPLTVGK